MQCVRHFLVPEAQDRSVPHELKKDESVQKTNERVHTDNLVSLKCGVNDICFISKTVHLFQFVYFCFHIIIICTLFILFLFFLIKNYITVLNRCVIK